MDLKLSRKLNIEHMVQNAKVVHYIFHKIFDSQLWPTATKRPILTYGSLDWWTETKNKFAENYLNRI